jgi:hypothetical protein
MFKVRKPALQQTVIICMHLRLKFSVPAVTGDAEYSIARELIVP